MVKTNTLGALAAAAGALEAVGLVMLMVLVVAVQPAEATFPGKNGNIAYSNLDGTDFEIYTIPPTGGTPTRLTNNNGVDDSRPIYSPDGTKIAFISDRDGNKEIYVMDAADRDGDGNGDNPTRLTTNAAVDANPSFSPDGTKIAFETLRDGNEEIYVMDAADRDGDGNGDNPIRLTTNAAPDQNPSYSPDGTRIAFETLRDSNKEIYMMDATDRDGDGNGDNPTRLTTNAAPDRYPDWGSHADSTPPKVMTTSPANNATRVARTTNVTATFSEDMKESSISGQTFKLVKLDADGTTTGITADVSYVVTTKKAKLDPATNLTSGRTYKATVTSGAQDLQNNALDQNPNIEGNQNKSWMFKVQ